MANPRRSSYSVNINDDGAGAGAGIQQSSSASSSTSSYFSSSPLLISLKHWLKKPHAVPFLLSAFLLLTWISLLLQQRSSHSSSSSSSSLAARIGNGRKDDDRDANLARFGSGSGIAKDKRGWLLDPVALAVEHGLKGGAGSCASIHVGEIRPGTLRGNHRHNACNETLVIWGAKTLFRLENHQIVDTGYAEVIVEGDEVAVATSPSGTAHALVNIDSLRSTFIIGCQDCIADHGSSKNNVSAHTDYKVWPDL